MFEVNCRPAADRRRGNLRPRGYRCRSKGGGDYQTITAAIEALPMFAYQRTVIFIRNGVYEEKLRIDQNYVTLRGESRDSTIIRYSILRSAWDEQRDPIGPAVININGDDAVLDQMTIENTQPEIGPMPLRCSERAPAPSSPTVTSSARAAIRFHSGIIRRDVLSCELLFCRGGGFRLPARLVLYPRFPILRSETNCGALACRALRSGAEIGRCQLEL